MTTHPVKHNKKLKQRNMVVLLSLIALMVLFYAITVTRISIGGTGM